MSMSNYTGCKCNWDIPDIESLPSHYHLPEYVLVERDDKSARVPAGAISAFPAYWKEVGREPESIKLIVDWKEVCRP